MKIFRTISQPLLLKERLLLVTEIGHLSSLKVILKAKLLILYKGEAPAPTAYNPKSDFDKVDPHGRAFSFGIAREAYAKVYVKENPVADKSIPGPGAYTVPPKIGTEAHKYSLLGKSANHSNPHYIA
jgi:hypothetical protein